MNDLLSADNSERTLLLAASKPQSSRPTPVLALQIAVPLLLRVCDSLAARSIDPFINQLVSELDVTGGDKRKTGYYVGLIGTCYGIATGLSAFQWNRVSDYVGRKPVVLIGLFGSALSMICFGLSRTLLGLIASRFLWGLLDATIGVGKSIVGEVTNSTNQAQAFGLTILAATLGLIVGPLIGGTLAKPSEHFPSIFKSEFWIAYPYFLPCLATASLIFLTFLFTLFCFRETAPAASWPTEASETSPGDKPLTLRELLTYPVLISAANYACLEFLFISDGALFPLFLAMPTAIGGLGFDPLQIGYVMSIRTTLSTLALALSINPLVSRFGERQLFVYTMAAHLPLWVLYPVLNLYAKAYGVDIIVWVGIGVMALLAASEGLGCCCIYAIIVAAAPNRRSLGATNGVSQTTVTIARVVAPALTPSLFSFSVEHKLLGGYAVYLFLLGFSCFTILVARRLSDSHAIPEDPAEIVP